MKIRLVSQVILVLILGFFALRATAQGFDPSTAIDIPTSVGHGTDLEHVDLMSGALVVKIPLLHLKGRGIDTDIVASYTSKVWSSSLYQDPDGEFWMMNEYFGQGSAMGNGWSIGFPQMVGATTGGEPTDPDGNFITVSQIHRFDGSSVSLASQVNAGGSFPPLFSYDGSFVKLPDGMTTMMKDGTSLRYAELQDQSGNWYGTTTLEDTNGNSITCGGPGSASHTCTDTVGRQITLGGARSSTGVTYTDDNGVLQTITINYSSNIGVEYPWIVDPICGNGPGQQAYDCVFNGASAYLISSIVLPNGTSYQFQYVDNGDGTSSGEISKIVLPTGGYIRYDYSSVAAPGMEESEASNRVVAHRYVSSDGTSGSEQQWTYNLNGSNTSTVTDPQSNLHSETFNNSTLGGDAWSPYNAFPPIQPIPSPLTSRDANSGGQLLKEEDKTWTNDTYEYAVLWAPWDANPELSSVATTLSGSSQQSIKTYSYARFGNVAEESDYDWAASGTYGTLLRTIDYTYLPDVNSAYAADSVHILDRVATESTYGNCAGSSGLCTQTTNAYDGYSSGRIAQGLTTTSSVVGHDYTTFPHTNTLRGNVTQVVRGNGLGGGSTTNDYAYNDLGDVLKEMDGMGQVTSYDYTDNYYGPQPSAPTLAFATTTTLPATSGAQHVIHDQYYLSGGQVAAQCGQNFPSGSLCAASLSAPQPDYAWLSYDLMNRATGMFFGDGGMRTLTYYDTSSPVSVVQKIAVTGTADNQSIRHEAFFDGLGRKIETELLSDPSGPTYTWTTYDALGRKYQEWNPTRCSSPSSNCLSESTWGITTHQYDALGRETKMIPPDGSSSSNNVTTSYSGNTEAVTDEAGAARSMTTDALGRLTQVSEGSYGYLTLYTYDSLGNLTCVEQHGGVSGTGCSSASTNDASSPWRVRRFLYDSLSRLTSSTNPETGTITYGFNSNSFLTSKTDNRGYQISYTPDALNRVTSKVYSDGEATVTYTYDAHGTGNYGIGLGTGMNDASGSTSWTYELMEREASETRTIGSITKTNSKLYYYDGSDKQIIYPAESTALNAPSVVLSVAPDFGGHTLSITDTTNNINYVQSLAYTPTGALSTATFGQSATYSGIQEAHSYNSRMQPLRLTACGLTACTDGVGSSTPYLLDLSYNFGLGANDNGNVFGITNNKNTARSQSFFYDGLNRLTQATSGSAWGVAFTYDPWGNLYQTNPVSGTGTNPMSVNQSATKSNGGSNNQLMLLGYTYDAAGNVLADGINYGCGTNGYTWNAEEQTSCTAGSTYTYDGDGTRVEKTGGNATSTLYWDGLAESDLSGNVTSEYIFLGQQRIARRDAATGNVHYYFQDMLGSSNVVATSAGAIENESDFYPFGGENVVTQNLTNQKFKFTGKERDTESGNDYFGARYYSSIMGRFMSPDWSVKIEPVPYSKLDNPQSLNLYAYLMNNPLGGIDSDGHACDAKPSAGNQQCTNAEGHEDPRDAKDQQQMGDPTLPTEVQPPPPSTADRLMSALMPKSPLDLALLVGTDGLGELGGAALRVLELAGEAGKTADYATIAVTETKEGLSIVSSSEARGLRPAVQAALKPGEVAVKGVGHAEVTGVNAARQMGLTPTGVAASRGICPSCADFLRTAGVAALSALKAILP